LTEKETIEKLLLIEKAQNEELRVKNEILGSKLEEMKKFMENCVETTELDHLDMIRLVVSLQQENNALKELTKL
jgi:hypothetical protein